MAEFAIIRIKIIESCVYGGSVWPEGWEGEAPRETAEALLNMGKARWVWVEEKVHHRDTENTEFSGRVEMAVGKRERGKHGA